MREREREREEESEKGRQRESTYNSVWNFKHKKWRSANIAKTNGRIFVLKIRFVTKPQQLIADFVNFSRSLLEFIKVTGDFFETLMVMCMGLIITKFTLFLYLFSGQKFVQIPDRVVFFYSHRRAYASTAIEVMVL